ncbi:TonB-dependent receptor [Rhabdobacter roseus]|uniref:Iron complex outermembrane receptor protein n=1 Tax=Rhabdobacter roseus TaxID=1655419 RepID=A0A840TP10_9BACT|nr:TonB-dependent receptor [Rhabdobacter roseus]MBB5283292.1 iron complex outermembrane receptor protein [Rhabdobacter roseus]
MVAQDLDSLRTRQLEEVTVRAFESRRTLLETPATVGLVSPRLLERYAPSTFVNAVNAVPGVRMEERSPGSYRFSVRGSLIRSPFGVRNVKFYWNGIPYTDASGNTPLNSLDFAAVQRMEIIKGPASSLYGAGTGGVVLMYDRPADQPAPAYALEQSVGVGQYGFRSWNTELKAGTFTVRYGHQEQAGYREHSAMGRDALMFSSSHQLGEKGTLSLLGLYSDLHYQTPGGITLAQYQTNPRLSRQPTATLPGSGEQGAGIYTRYALLGGSYDLPLSARWNQTVSLYLTTNDFANPFISNYEKRDEQGIGGRNVWQYQSQLGRVESLWTSGFEWQYGRSAQRNYDNLRGVPGDPQTAEDIRTASLSVFSQWEVTLPSRLTATAGLSYNTLRYGYEGFIPAPYLQESSRFDGLFMPRVAINQRLGSTWAVTASLSDGFSPPTLQEVRPSAGGFRRDLNAERGINRELGLRKFGNRFSAEVNLYNFGLRQAIVRRTQDNGAEYFINAGKTQQNGVEWRADYDLLKSTGPVALLRLWHTGTYTRYTYQDFQQGDANLDGKYLPGIPRLIHTTGVDALLRYGLSVFATYQQGGSFYLNDANSVESTPYHQFFLRATWRKGWGDHLYTEVAASKEWVRADIYSLGFDLNAFGNRYYNAAPKSNGWVGVKLGWRWGD